ncbi:Uncharacterised protein [Chlamydia trachomatis]|nr:Uncharacterised protein [Chlamydia trachomatis]
MLNDRSLAVNNVAVFIDIALAVDLLESYELRLGFHLIRRHLEGHFLNALELSAGDRELDDLRLNVRYRLLGCLIHQGANQHVVAGGQFRPLYTVEHFSRGLGVKYLGTSRAGSGSCRPWPFVYRLIFIIRVLVLGNHGFVTGVIRLSRVEVFEGYQFRVLADLPHGYLKGHLGFARLQGSWSTRNGERLGG